MLVYIITTLLTVLLTSHAHKLKKRHKKKIWFFLSALPLTIISSIRYGVGQDYFYTYVKFFNYILYGETNQNIDIGFEYLIRAIQLFTKDYVWLFSICAILFFYFTFRSIYENSSNPALSAFLLVSTQYYFIFLNGMRQMLAASIILFSIKYVKERKMMPFFVSVAIASSFHLTAIVCLPIYFLYSIKINYFKAGLIATIFALFSTRFFAIVANILSNTKYAIYFGSSFDTGRTGYIQLLMELAILVFAYMFYKRKDIDDPENKTYNLFTNLKFVSFLIALFEGSLPLLMRIRWYYGFSTIILIPLTLKRIPRKKDRFLIGAGIVLLFTIYIVYTVGFENANSVLPYRTIFER